MSVDEWVEVAVQVKLDSYDQGKNDREKFAAACRKAWERSGSVPRPTRQKEA